MASTTPSPKPINLVDAVAVRYPKMPKKERKRLAAYLQTKWSQALIEGHEVITASIDHVTGDFELRLTTLEEDVVAYFRGEEPA